MTFSAKFSQLAQTANTTVSTNKRKIRKVWGIVFFSLKNYVKNGA
jgi:hypothetical protein